MIHGPADIVAYAVIAVLLAAFILIAGGYVMLIRQALRAGRRARALRVLISWRGIESQLDLRAVRLIYTGAKIGAIVFSSLLVLLFGSQLLRRR